MPIAASAPPGGVLDRLVRGMADLSLAISGFLLVAIFVLINVEIAFRYLLGASTLVADEYSGYMFAALVFLGLNNALYDDKLIRIDLPGRWSAFANHAATRFLTALLGLVLNAVLLYASILTLATSIRFQSRSIQASKTLLAMPQSMVVIGLALLCLGGVALLFRAARQFRRGGAA